MFHFVPSAWRGYSLALSAVAAFSTAVLFTKWGLNVSQLDFYSLAIWGWSSGIFLATLIFYMPLKSQRQRLWPELKQHAPFFTLISALTVVNGATWFYGMSQISGGVVSLIDQNVLLWSFVLGALFLGERFSWRQSAAISLTLLGLGIISSLKGEATPLGVISLLICGLSISTQSLLIKRYAKPFNALSLTFWRGWAMAVVAWSFWMLLGKFQWNIEPLAFTALCIGQFFGLFMGRAAYIKAHEYLPMSQLSFLMLGIPVVVLVGSFLWLNEPLGTQKLVGASIMMLGLAWFISRKTKRQAH